MREPVRDTPTHAGAVAAYKTIFKAVLDRRPSGMRLRLAHAIGKNRSFISQISNPAYEIPIPAQHLNTIFEVCHFSPAEKAKFLEAYAEAHPHRAGRLGDGPRERSVTLHLPDLGSRERNGQLDALLRDFAKRLIALLRDEGS
jgi:hypothetical protein